MKRGIVLLLCVALVMSMTACSNQEKNESSTTGINQEKNESDTAGAGQEKIESSSAVYTAGTYTGSSKGHSSDVVVEAVFSDSKIESVTIDASGETENFGQAAVEDLQKQFLEAQNAEIDGVSGATETSDAAKRAMQTAIDQASGTEKEKAELAAGTYTAKASSYGTKGMMEGEVTIADGKIAEIVIISESDSQSGQWFGVAEEKLIPRIIETQSLAVDSITGATTSSGAIKAIVAQAIEQAGGNSADWYTPVEKSTEKVVLDGYDVIVVGLGGSGILSYASASLAGASVFGIEAAGEIGGNSISTYGPMVVNSKRLNDLYNNGQDNIDADDVYKTWIEYVGNEEKADIIYRTVYENGEIMDYYMDNFGFDFAGKAFGGDSGFLPSFVRQDWTKEWIVFTADENNTKWYDLGPDKLWQFQNALDKAKGMNEKSDYKLELTADKLIFDEAGNVEGVHAVYYDGTEYEIYGKTVILSTGGFLGNDEMMKEVFGSTIRAIGDTVNKGAGIRMGISAGGATYALDTLPMTHVSQIPNIIRDDSLTADEKTVLTSLALTTDVNALKEDGSFYQNMDDTGTNEGDSSELTVGIVYAPGFHYYNIYSEEDIQNIKTNGLTEVQAASAPIALTSGGMVQAKTPIDTIEHIMEVGIETKNVFKGTASELAEQLGMDKETTIQSLGDDEAVYYLVECAGYAYGTVGGLDVDANCNVLREDGTPIVNLFATGQDSEGVENVGGKPYTPWAGQAQMWTFVSGKIAGEAAAEFALEK